MKKYNNRIVDNELDVRLDTFKGILIVGPKWCGKTTTGMQKSKSIIRIQDPDKRQGYIETANIKPSLLLIGDNPRLIDEWQDIPSIWDAVRVACDDRDEKGLFILTGSTAVENKNIMHSGIGRITRLRMYPMSLYESSESNGLISLNALFADNKLNVDGIKSNLTIEKLIFSACRGGWPDTINNISNNVLMVAKDYLNNICEADISSIDAVSRNPVLARLILKSYARNISTLAKKTNILQDVKSNQTSVSMDTLDAYLNALERLFVIDDLQAWTPSIRSKSSIRASNKRQFVDPSIAVAALGVNPDYFLSDLKTFGFIFECLCIRDLKVYSQSLGGTMSYYRDKTGLEADAVLHLDNGQFALIEFKLGSFEIDMGAKNLISIKNLIIEYNLNNPKDKMREPDLLLIVTGGEMAYTRDDGVKIIPIGCLKN